MSWRARGAVRSGFLAACALALGFVLGWVVPAAAVYPRCSLDTFKFRRDSPERIVALTDGAGRAAGWGLVVDPRGHVACLDAPGLGASWSGRTASGRPFRLGRRVTMTRQGQAVAGPYAVFETDVGPVECKALAGGALDNEPGLLLIADPWARDPEILEIAIASATDDDGDGGRVTLTQPVPERFEGAVCFRYSGAMAGIYARRLRVAGRDREFHTAPMFKYWLPDDRPGTPFLVRHREVVLFLAVTGLVALGAMLTRRHPDKFTLVFGGGLFVLGVLVFAGNVTGRFPTLPYLGYACMSLGGAIVGIDAARPRDPR